MLAKSKPEKTIKEHSDDAKNGALYLAELLNNFFGRRLLELLVIIAFYHDIGKSNRKFQKRIKKLLRRLLKDEVPHNYLSACMLGKDFGLSVDEKNMVILAVAHHHINNFNINENYELIKYNLEEIEEEKEQIIQEMGIEFEISKKNLKLLKTLNENPYKLKKNIKDISQYVILKGLLRRIDHSVSAGMKVETGWTESIEQKTSDFMAKQGFVKNGLQKFVLENKNKNIMAVGQTGSGKTESAMLWAGESKLFFTLPVRVSANAIFDRVINTGIDSAGLVHSTSLDHLEEKDIDFQNVYHESRLFTRKMTITTVDQVLKFPMLYTGFEKELATLAYSKLVIDEIQSYDPDVVALFIKGLEIINEYGGRFYVMTATLPAIYKDEIDKRISGVMFKEYINNEMLRHRIKINDYSILDAAEEIREKSCYSKVLVIANTVKRAVEIYDSLLNSNVYLLHSRFTREHKSELEKQVQEFSENGIWVTTQIVEASLDIDFDYLFTEAVPLDRLFQRLGRCYRNRPLEDEKINIFLFKSNISGYGTVYGNIDRHGNREGFLIDKSMEMLQGYSELREKDKLDMVNSLYSKEVLEGQENRTFLNHFEETLNWLDDRYDNIYKNKEISGKDAQKRLRKLDTINIIPECYVAEVEDLLDQLYNATNDDKKRETKKKINRRIVDVQNLAVKGREKLLDENLGLYRIPDSSYYFNEVDKRGLVIN